jgi:hypothetical protein
MPNEQSDTYLDHTARYVSKLRAVADFVEAWPDLPQPDVTPSRVSWHLKENKRWREHVEVITRELGPRWVVTRYDTVQTLTTTIDARLGQLTVYVPLHDPVESVRPVVDLSEFSQARR